VIADKLNVEEMIKQTNGFKKVYQSAGDPGSSPG
jgi:hypothetical protein